MARSFQEVRRLKRQLGPTWNVFFGGFGKLKPVQYEAIPRLLKGLDCVIASPTASGKTEAALAPILARLMAGGSELPKPALLYIIPTRALVADMERRFAGAFAELGLSVAFRTGDSPHVPTDFVQVLFTTPESLDSMLCRIPRVWTNIAAVVLDELHLLDNSYRGDQVRLLLRRLELDWLESRPQKVILSATLHAPGEMADRYGLNAAAIVAAGEPRSLNFATVKTLAEALVRCKAERRYKALVFCNSRKECETLADLAVEERLWPYDGVFVHHGSLSRAERQETEAGFREKKGAICFATTTLELGVDIGDVSAAIMYRPPHNSSSFMQRLGRACRREKEVFCLGIALVEGDEELFEEYRQFARTSLSEPTDYSPDYSVVIQQLLSLLFASPQGIAASDLFEYVSPICPMALFEQILDKLVSDGLMLRRRHLLLASEKTMDLGERGEVHSNIADERTVEVVDSATGRKLGEMSPWGDAKGTIALAGKVWTITGRDRGKLVVSPSGHAPRTGSFAPRQNRGKYFPMLPPEVQAIMRGRTSPDSAT
jgi:ATP-dependent helicase Lhr and Lhr-like helicase